MAKLMVVFFCMCILIPVNINYGQDLKQIRELFFLTGKDSKHIQTFLKVTQKTNGNPLLIGYKGIAIAMNAREKWNPMEKLKYFQLGRDSLERAICLDPESFELHFYSLSISKQYSIFFVL